MGTIQLKGLQLNGGGNQQCAGKWYAHVDHYSTISHEELCQLAADDSHVERAEVAYILSAIVKQIEELAFMGHSIVIPELGTLSVGVESSTVDDYADVNCEKLIRRLKLNLRVTPEFRAALKNVTLRMK